MPVILIAGCIDSLVRLQFGSAYSWVSSIYVVWYSLDSETFHTAAKNAVVGPKAFHVPQNIFFGPVALQIQAC